MKLLKDKEPDGEEEEENEDGGSNGNGTIYLVAPLLPPQTIPDEIWLI